MIELLETDNEGYFDYYYIKPGGSSQEAKNPISGNLKLWTGSWVAGCILILFSWQNKTKFCGQ